MPRKQPRISSLSDLTPAQWEAIRSYSRYTRDSLTREPVFIPSLYDLQRKAGFTYDNARTIRGLLTTAQRKEIAANLTAQGLMRAHTCLTCWKPLYPTQHRYCSRACYLNRRGHHPGSPTPSSLRSLYVPLQCDPSSYCYDPTVRPITTTAQLEAMLQRMKSNPTDPLAHLDRASPMDRSAPPATTPPTPL